MPYVEDEIAVADAAVGDNISGGKWYQQSSRARRIVRAGVTGGNAIAECKLDIFYGTRKVGSILNSTSGAVTPKDDDMKIWSDRQICYPNDPLNIVVVTAPTVTDIVLALDIIEMVPKSPRRRY